MRWCQICHRFREFPDGDICIDCQITLYDDCPLPFEDRWDGKELDASLAKRCRKVKCAFVEKVYKSGYFYKEIPKGCEFDECTSRYIRRVICFWIVLKPHLKAKAERLMQSGVRRAMVI